MRLLSRYFCQKNNHMDKAAWPSADEGLKNLLLVFFIIVELYRHFNKPKDKFVDVIVLQDTSQSNHLQLSADDIVCRYRYGEDITRRAIFRYSTIGEHCKTEAIEATIGDLTDSVEKNTDNRLDFRVKEIESFYCSVAAIIASQLQAHHQQALPPQQGIFATIVEEFNVFDRATDKILLICSGLFERSSLFDSQSPVDMALLFSNPKAIARRFKKAHWIKKLDKVTMEFLYEPTDMADWKRFLKMTDVLSLVFAPKGARICIKTTSKIHDL